MRILFIFLITSLVFLNTNAQTADLSMHITGIVIDSVTAKPLGFVTVALQNDSSKLNVKTVISKEDGSFDIKATPGKKYNLVLAFAGYTSKTLAVSLQGNKTELGTLQLSPSPKQMKEVVVTAQHPVMKREVDGISYDVSADPESVALTALDIMRKVPLLSVDASDNIKLKGSGNYKILVNGKESALISKNPSDILRSMPATNIEKIEVITTPPAKYDAEGLAGIINIITKKNIDQGYKVGINTRYNTLWGPGINLNGTVKQGKFGLSGFFGMNKRNVQTSGFGNNQTFLADHSVLVQNGENTFTGNGKYGNGELSFEFDSLNLLTGSVEFYHGNNSQSSTQLSELTSASGIVQQSYRVNNSGYNNYEGLGTALNFQHGFSKNKGRLLTLSYKYNYSPNKQFNDNVFLDTLNYQQPAYRQYNSAGNKEHTIQLDYVHPFKKITLEAGGKAIIRNNYSDFETNNFSDSAKEYVLSSSQSNNFNYHQNIYSVYNSYQAKWEKWTVKGGLRIEHTTIHADFISSSSSVDQQYDNVIPSISVQRNFKSSSFNLGYTDRISRPGIYQLNPFVDISNPKFVSTGNPDLKPELNHTIELNYSNFSKGSINIGLSYAFSTNSIQNVTNLQVNPKGDTVTVTTYQNLGSNNRVGLNVNTNITIAKNLSISLNGEGSYIRLKGTYNGQFYRNDGYTGHAFLNAGYKFGKDYRLGFDAGVFSGDVNLQGKASGFMYNSYSFSKSFLDKKITIALAANNPYSRYFTYHSHSSTPDFYQSSYGQNPYRSFALRFNYRFGKLNSDIKRNERGINNDDTKGGKSSGVSQ